MREVSRPGSYENSYRHEGELCAGVRGVFEELLEAPEGTEEGWCGDVAIEIGDGGDEMVEKDDGAGRVDVVVWFC